MYRGGGLREEVGSMSTSWNRDRQLAFRSVLKGLPDDALYISAGSLFQSVLAVAIIALLLVQPYLQFVKLSSPYGGRLSDCESWLRITWV